LFRDFLLLVILAKLYFITAGLTKPKLKKFLKLEDYKK